jgi:dihydrodipicolinate synthase/N-acetylneuraminate lyase
VPIPASDPIVVAPTPIPFTEDDRVDYAALRSNVQRWVATPLSGLVVGTAIGEERALSDAEKVACIRAVHAALDGRRCLIAGIDTPSSREALRLTRRYAAVGADLVRVRVPRNASPPAVRAYFAAVTAGSPVPVLVIHQTFTRDHAAPPSVLADVVRRDNVFGYITGPDVRFEARVRLRVPATRRFWICNGGLLLYGTLMGADGACMWLGAVAPALCRAIVDAGYRGRFADARPLQTTATRLDEGIGRYGVAGVKTALTLLGFDGARTLTPGYRPDQTRTAAIRAVLRDAGLL